MKVEADDCQRDYDEAEDKEIIARVDITQVVGAESDDCTRGDAEAFHGFEPHLREELVEFQLCEKGENRDNKYARVYAEEPERDCENRPKCSKTDYTVLHSLLWLVKVSDGLKSSGFYLFGGFAVTAFAGCEFGDRSFKLGLIEVWPKNFTKVDFGVSGL